MRNNIVLIGMPGAGKSTAGVVLAKTLGCGFVDTDILLGARLGSTLQAFIDKNGIDAFLRAEESAALSLDCDNTVIATGGSMILSERAMARLKSGSVTVFLDVPLPELKKRLRNITTRGITLRPGQSIGDIYSERMPIYQKYADMTVPQTPGGASDLESVVAEIARLIKRFRRE